MPAYLALAKEHLEVVPRVLDFQSTWPVGLGCAMMMFFQQWKMLSMIASTPNLDARFPQQTGVLRESINTQALEMICQTHS